MHTNDYERCVMKVDKKQVFLILLVVIAIGLVWYLNSSKSPVVTTNVHAVPVENNLYLVFLTLENPGPPLVLTKVTSKEGRSIHIMGNSSSSGLVIPAGSKPGLSADGAHIMLSLTEGNRLEGTMIPLTLHFGEAGSVQVKAIVEKPAMKMGDGMDNSGGSAMDHSLHPPGNSHEVANSEAAPSITMTVRETEDASWVVRVDTENFEFTEPVEEPLAHSDGQGHGHLYLNGLKLQRMYSNEAIVGELPAGQHTLVVTLNTNEHKNYTVKNVPVSATAVLNVD